MGNQRLESCESRSSERRPPGADGTEARGRELTARALVGVTEKQRSEDKGSQLLNKLQMVRCSHVPDAIAQFEESRSEKGMEGPELRCCVAQPDPLFTTSKEKVPTKQKKLDRGFGLSFSYSLSTFFRPGG